MDANHSEKKLVKNEQLIRNKNSAIGRDVKKYLRNSEEATNTPIAFICECSNLDCNEHITTSISTYEKLHLRKDRFTIFPGHSIPSIEKLIEHDDDFDVVEKFALSN
jgi:hypothetical protein